MVTGGFPFADMLIWLQATLPVNSYFVDGAQTGDTYQYKYANQKASKTYTDDDYYYVHNGKFDIFNFSRKPGGKNKDLLDDFAVANKFKTLAFELLNKGDLCFLNTENDEVFSYIIKYKYSSILVVLNKNLNYTNNAAVTVKNLKKDDIVVPIEFGGQPKLENGKISFTLMPGEINVFMISKNLQAEMNKKKK